MNEAAELVCDPHSDTDQAVGPHPYQSNVAVRQEKPEVDP